MRLVACSKCDQAKLNKNFDAVCGINNEEIYFFDVDSTCPLGKWTSSTKTTDSICRKRIDSCKQCEHYEFHSCKLLSKCAYKTVLWGITPSCPKGLHNE